jgi:NADH:ubiquinone oxidoreductase subunit K
VTLGLVQVLFVAAALLAAGAFALGHRRESGAALAGVPALAAGSGLALVGVSRFSASLTDPLAGQVFATVVALAALAVVVVGVALLGRESQR